MINPENYPKGIIDYSLLDKEFDRTKAKVFIGNNAAFYGTLLCSLNFAWIENIPTAQTNGISIQWNPHFFMALDPESRKTILLHELKHVANLHGLRRGDRDPDYWNFACDYVINGELEDDGYYMEGFPYLLDSRFRGMSAEQVYDILIEEKPQLSSALLDLMSPADVSQIISKVVSAQQIAAMSGSDVDPILGQVIKRFLSPKLPWQTLVTKWMSEKFAFDWSWRRPNRRYPDMYLPSMMQSDEGALAHLHYYTDVSGSIFDKYIVRFNSEFKYIKDIFNPTRMTMFLFDTKIRKTIEVYEDDLFEEVQVVGRGGTNLAPVREQIIKDNPTAAIIFTDLEVTPMQPLPKSCRTDILWIVVNNNAKAPFGKTINIRE